MWSCRLAPTPRQLDLGVDAVLGEMGRRADARQHQQVRAVDRAAAEQHLPRGRHRVLATGLPEGHPGGAVARDLDLRREGAGLDREVRPRPRRLEVGLVGRPAAAALAGDLVETSTFLLGSVEVVVGLQTGADRALHERVAQLVGVAAVLDVQRSRLPVQRRAQPRVGLRTHEVGQDVVEPPADRAVLVAPGVVVDPVAPDVDHRVHRRAAAERLHPRPVGAAAVQLLLLGRRVVPVPLGLELRRERRRDVHLVGIRLAARLEQQDGRARILAQPGGQHRTGTAGPDDDVVKGACVIGVRHAVERTPFNASVTVLL